MVRVFTDLNDVYPSGLFRRLAAMVYDLFLLFALVVLVGFIGVALLGSDMDQHPLFALFRLAVFSVPLLFYGFFWRRSGQTLGMLAWRIRVQTPQGQPLNLRQTLLRLLGGLLSWGCLGLGYLWLFFNHEKRTWPDLLSGTEVVVIPKKS